MSAILAKLMGWIVTPILEWATEKIVSFLRRYFTFKKEEANSQKANQEVLDKTTAAQTPEERKDAAEDTIRNF
jgi:response regulator of citrate/malate metabolism